MTRPLLIFAACAAALAPVVIGAPRPRPAGQTVEARDGGRRSIDTLDDVVAAAKDSGATGRELVNLATVMVHRMYTHYSSWHLWLTPAGSAERGQGNSFQYNLALAEVLGRLGFSVQPVHAARVRMEHHPWYHTGHTWLRVRIEGRTLDVCASRSGNRAGQVGFLPVTDVLPLGPVTRLDSALALAPFVVVSVWKSWLTGRGVQRWLYRPFGETA
ncbi:hypothetical protein [Acidipropionibacterium virtanenii]|uniref:Transglutaminase-like domain-containing protein n=1 Tax=Acidipropionibacterium virtanenii TaxID=2057246 RepID=A0A344USB6_9ACTN|nr:hypothetical protein [Acidipropionibacterium virtanenii]AXE38164.1 hypothetical protein JS278_00981 [Acidipropionibacterium virtanenii]